MAAWDLAKGLSSRDGRALSVSARPGPKASAMPSSHTDSIRVPTQGSEQAAKCRAASFQTSAMASAVAS